MSDIVLIGVGACTAAGECAVSTMASVRAGISAFAEHTSIRDKQGDPVVLAAAPYIDQNVPVVDRMIALGIPAALEALQPLINSNAEIPVQLIIGLPEPRPGLSENFSAQIKSSLTNKLNEHWPVPNSHVIPAGNSSGLMAMETSVKMIREDPKTICLVGGIDSYIAWETLDWLDGCEQLHSETYSWGFCPGEAAAFSLLCSSQMAKYLKLEQSLNILTIATAQEENLIKTETVCTGDGLSMAFKKAFELFEKTDEKISVTICDLNGEPYRADEFGFSVTRTSQYFEEEIEFNTPADVWGDVGAASGPLYVALSASTQGKGNAKGKHTLIWTSSECGYRSAAILAAV